MKDAEQIFQAAEKSFEATVREVPDISAQLEVIREYNRTRRMNYLFGYLAGYNECLSDMQEDQNGKEGT